MAKSRSWTPGIIIRCPAYRGGFRVWRVTGNYLGGEHQENVVGLESLDLTASTEGPEMMVPMELLDAAIGIIVDTP